MSEEILKALMQLFAIILKQDGGVEENEIKYVWNFLKSQLGETGTEEYFDLFHQVAELDKKKENDDKKLTSVLDSVRILGICKKINKTLNSSQKFVVLVRLFELAAADKKLTDQRMAIITTASQVFKISKERHASIESFVLGTDDSMEKDPSIIFLSSRGDLSDEDDPVEDGDSKKDIVVLRIQEVNLYFIRYSGKRELYLNGLGLHRNRVYLLAKGSTLKLSQGKPLYYSDISAKFLQSETENQINFKVENISFNFKNGTKGLSDISLQAQHGNMIGIMGSSGAGKTTLLNVLSGIDKPTSGQILVNGQNLHYNREEVSGSIGFIPQDDLLIDELTVFENLFFNAKFCFNHLSDEEIKEKVDQTLESLGLYSKRNLRVGSPFNKTISGGQRKRLNIALELVREPAILFVDEPTSGLSSRDSENVMDLLRELTLKGKLIFIVIHQPSSEIFKMFDQLVILDTGGVLVYYGNPVEAVMYFKLLDNQINSQMGECPTCGNVNPELIFNIIEARVVDEYGNYTKKRKVSPEKWESFFKSGKVEYKVEENNQSLNSNLRLPGWLKQLSIYFHRDFKTKISNTQYVLLSLLEAPVLGLMLAYIIRYIADPSSEIYKFRENENIPIYIFMALIVAVFLGLTQSAEEIFKDRKILKREQFLHLSRSSYLLSKVSILFLISAIQAFLFVWIANSILEIKNMNVAYWFALFSTAAFANLLGLNISSSFNSAITIYIVIPLLIIPMMVLSGAMFSFEKLNRNISSLDKVPVLAELMPTRWSYEALMVHQFKNNFFQTNFYDLDKKITNADFKLSYYIPEIEKRLRKINTEYNGTGKLDETVNDLILIANELTGEEYIDLDLEINENLFDPETYNNEKFNQIENILSELNLYFLEVFTRQNKMKNNKVKNLLKNLKDTYYKYLDDYHNESVADQVRKIYERKKIVEFNQRLVRMIDPVYMDPVPRHSFDFRTHFFAPKKHFLGKYFDTYSFNMLVIWVLTGLLYFSLYFNLLRKIINLRINRKKSKENSMEP